VNKNPHSSSKKHNNYASVERQKYKNGMSLVGGMAGGVIVFLVMVCIYSTLVLWIYFFIIHHCTP